MPSSRARLGSLPWALCVRTLHRPFRSSRHRDISFNRGPASFRHGPGVSSSARLPFCGDKNTKALHTPHTQSRGNQDRAFKRDFHFKLWKYNEALARHIGHWSFERIAIFTFKCYYRHKEVLFQHFTLILCSVGRTFRVLDRNVDD